MRHAVRVLVPLLLVAIICACGGDSDGAPTPEPALELEPLTIGTTDDIIIGVSAALSGSQAAIGQDLADAVDMAIEEFGGSVAGHAVRSARADDGCNDAEMAADAAERLVDTVGLVGVVGPMCTTGAQAANDIYETAGVVHITPSATRDSLSAGDGSSAPGFFFRTVWRDERQAHVQSAYAAGDLDASSAVVIDDGDPYGKTLADAFIPAFEEAGGTVLSRERIERGTTNFDTIARQILTGDPDLIVFQGLDPEGALLLRDLREAGFRGDFMGPDSLFNAQDFIATSGQAAEGAILTAGPVADSAFLDRFNARFGRIPATAFVLQAYDATRAILDTVQAQTEGASGDLQLDRAQFAATLRQRSEVGLTGPITVDGRGDRAGTSPREAGLAIYRVTNSAFEQVE